MSEPRDTSDRALKRLKTSHDFSEDTPSFDGDRSQGRHASTNRVIPQVNNPVAHYPESPEGLKVNRYADTPSSASHHVQGRPHDSAVYPQGLEQLEADHDVSEDTQFPQARRVQERPPGFGVPLAAQAYNPVMGSQGPHYFNRAHDIVMNHPIFIANPENDSAVMEFLANRGTIDATLTATARHPPPECHAETRLSLRDRIMTWFRDPDRDSNLLWLRGPAGVGKSAVAQTIAQECKNQGLLVATFFFSRPNNRNDPDCVIPTLAYQFSRANLSYKHAVTSLLIKDPRFFENALPTQFQHLIVDLLSSCDYDPTFGPILIVLDGLDECHSDDSQKAFIELVTKFASGCRKDGLPYVWIITSRPEWQIVSTFDELQGPGQYHEERLHVHDPESQKDVERVLRYGFSKIRQKYRDSFMEGEPWPGEAQIRVVSEMASGHFAFADTLVKFVGNAVVEDPVDQLEICLDFLQGNNVPEGGANPLDPLALLYRGILQTVHKMHHHNAILILATSFLHTEDMFSDSFRTSIGDIVNFLFLDKGKFHRSLRKLHSVVSVPSVEHPDQPLEIYHRSFGDFIQQICHTGEFGTTELDIMKTWWKCIAGWCRIMGHQWKTMGDRMGAISGAMKWPNQHSQQHFDKLPAAALEQIWRNPSDEIISAVFNDIHGVDFDYFWVHLDSDDLSNMIFKLHFWQEKNPRQSATDCNILRVEPHYPIDTELLVKYQSLLGAYHVEKAYFDWAISKGQNQWNYSHMSIDHCSGHTGYTAQAIWHPHAFYFFYGHGATTQLVIMYPDKIEPQEYLREAFDQIGQGSSIFQPLVSQHLELLSTTHKNRLPMDRRLHAGEASLIYVIPRIVGYSKQPDPVGHLNQVVNMATLASSHSSDVLNLETLFLEYIFSMIPKDLHLSAYLIIAFFGTGQSMGHGPYVAPITSIWKTLSPDSHDLDVVLPWLEPFFHYISSFKDCNHDMLSSFLDLDEIYHTDSYFVELASQACLLLASWYIQYFNYHAAGCILEDCPHIHKNEKEYVFGYSEWLALMNWRPFNKVHAKDAPKLALALQDFQFCHLGGKPSHHPYHCTKLAFIVTQLWKQISSLEDVSQLVRVDCIYETDYQLLAKFEGLYSELSYQMAMFPLDVVDQPNWYHYAYPLSLHHDSELGTEDWHSEVQWKVLFLGHDSKSCLVAMGCRPSMG